MSKNSNQKEKILYSSQIKWHTNYRGRTIQVTEDFSSENMESRKKVFENSLKKRIVHHYSISKQNIFQEWRWKSFSNEVSLKDFVANMFILGKWNFSVSLEKSGIKMNRNSKYLSKYILIYIYNL